MWLCLQIELRNPLDLSREFCFVANFLGLFCHTQGVSQSQRSWGQREGLLASHWPRIPSLPAGSKGPAAPAEHVPGGNPPEQKAPKQQQVAQTPNYKEFLLFLITGLLFKTCASLLLQTGSLCICFDFIIKTIPEPYRNLGEDHQENATP